MSPHVSPRSVADRRARGRRAFAGIIAEAAFALSLFGIGYLISLAVASA